MVVFHKIVHNLRRTVGVGRFSHILQPPKNDGCWFRPLVPVFGAYLWLPMCFGACENCSETSRPRPFWGVISVFVDLRPKSAKKMFQILGSPEKKLKILSPPPPVFSPKCPTVRITFRGWGVSPDIYTYPKSPLNSAQEHPLGPYGGV